VAQSFLTPAVAGLALLAPTDRPGTTKASPHQGDRLLLVADPINALAAEAAAAYRDGRAYTYAAPDALSARILLVEEGGGAFPEGEGIGSPLDVSSHIWWSGILQRAEYLPGMYSWWNAVPCGLDRPNTVDDLGRGGKFLRRALDLHADLQVVIAVGEAAGKVAATTKAELARRGIKLLKPRSPHHTDNAHRLAIVDVLVEARLYAYPLGF
jgi:hypothetical protein